jgi:hypothetical protein
MVMAGRQSGGLAGGRGGVNAAWWRSSATDAELLALACVRRLVEHQDAIDDRLERCLVSGPAQAAIV